MSWDRFLDGFDRSEPEAEERREQDPIWAQIDALYDERVERGDPRWFPSGPDPQGLEQLVEERRRR